MLKKLVGLIRKYRLLQQKKRHHERWAKMMQTGGALRGAETEKGEILVDYHDTRMVGQRHVTPRVMRPFGMWRW